ncbi:hypothetical protein BU25DRAFT_90252 [Macroventuria anomochaeta]|uniref:Uncharacterized protein n=1 Tax=Macroventuria anomochaeta TaxID=301207 RepID=A0ACB6RXF3_9PLEO|nr:uncharacterized protein BU25DRAFT_90252 [Macroventuria anomochaeta]KAF2626551.1 hypothetical protein BU25DRAFT_90252 [Macroventuria anomochaeta]
MPQTREVTTCTRCRQSKRRCNKAKPSCTRCERGGIPCTYEEGQKKSPPSSYSDLTSANTSKSATTPPTPIVQHQGVRKRNRTCLSCSRCHRLKVKCDQKQPCARCSYSGVQAACTYTHRAKLPQQSHEQAPEQPQHQEVPFALTDEDPEFVVATWYLRKRGSTHYRAILDRMESLSSLHLTPFAIAVKQHIEGHSCTDFALPSNYPFGSSESARYASLQQVHELIQNCRADVASLMAGYFRSFHPSLPVFDKSAFRAKLEDFWKQPETIDLSWLAQFLAVLGLGAYTIEYGANTTGHSNAAAAEFLYASEACLAKTTYMARPTTTTISTLCLMVVAKQATTATCWTLDTCWNVMGIVVRLSMMMVLHKNWMPGYDEPAIVCERALRCRLWILIVYLDTQMSLRTGQQSMLPQGTVDLTTSCVNPRDCWDTIIPRSLPIICHFLSRLNAHDGEIFSYDEVLSYDSDITQFMRESTVFLEDEVVRLTLDIFFRRALLAVHCQYALRPNASVLFPASYNSTFEHNLALLNHYHQLSSISPHTQLLAQPYMLDFLAAAFTTCMLLLSPEASSSCSLIDESTGLTYRQAMLNALMRCMDILAKENSKVLCFQSGFQQLKRLYELTPKE